MSETYLESLQASMIFNKGLNTPANVYEQNLY